MVVNYYDVTGTTISQLHDWLRKYGPRDPGTQKTTPATSSWSIGAGVRSLKTRSQCTITAVSVKLSAVARLPRLTAGTKLPAPALSSWNAYVAALEDRNAAKLQFVHDRLGEVEGAIKRSNCGNWQKAADAAIARVGEEQATAFKLEPDKLPKLGEPDADTANGTRKPQS